MNTLVTLPDLQRHLPDRRLCRAAGNGSRRRSARSSRWMLCSPASGPTHRGWLQDVCPARGSGAAATTSGRTPSKDRNRASMRCRTRSSHRWRSTLDLPTRRTASEWPALPRTSTRWTCICSAATTGTSARRKDSSVPSVYFQQAIDADPADVPGLQWPGRCLPPPGQLRQPGFRRRLSPLPSR